MKYLIELQMYSDVPILILLQFPTHYTNSQKTLRVPNILGNENNYPRNICNSQSYEDEISENKCSQKRINGFINYLRIWFQDTIISDV